MATTKMKRGALKAWALRHKATGLFMPARMHKGHGGWSGWIPGFPEPEGCRGCNGILDEPRIFFTARSARGAATQWTRGFHTVAYETVHDDWGVGREQYIKVTPPPVPRARGDLEIVALEIRELK